MANASYAPISITAPGSRANGYQPTLAGGSSYAPSADIRAGAAKLQQSVMAGRGAPSALSPANYGKTSALDLTGTADPTTDAAFATGVPDRTNLGAPAAPTLEQPYSGPTGSALSKVAAKSAAVRRQKQLAA